MVILSTFSTALGFGALIIPVSQMTAQKHREVELLAQGCTAGGRTGIETWAPDPPTPAQPLSQGL